MVGLALRLPLKINYNASRFWVTLPSPSIPVQVSPCILHPRRYHFRQRIESQIGLIPHGPAWRLAESHHITSHHIPSVTKLSVWLFISQNLCVGETVSVAVQRRSIPVCSEAAPCKRVSARSVDFRLCMSADSGDC